MCVAGMQDAVDLLHPLLTDTVDFVKQGALIATALVLMQQPESKVASVQDCLDMPQHAGLLAGTPRI